MRRGWMLALLLAAGAASGSKLHAQTPANVPSVSVVEPPTPLLPGDPRFVDATNVPGDSSDVQAILKEDGLARQAAKSVAATPGTAPSGWVVVDEFTDATGAFSAYTFLRAGGHPAPAPRVNPTDFVTPGGERVFLSGVSVVRSHLPGEVDAKLLREIEIGLPKIGGRHGLAPLLPTYVPAPGLDAGSLRYALGPLGYQAMHGVLPAGMLSWEKSAEAATADYRGASGKGTLTLLLYPTPQIAGDRGRAIQNEINAAGPNSLGTVAMRRIGPLVGITSGGFSAEQAKTLVDSLHLNAEVTFDSPKPLEFHAEVKKTASLLQNIAVLCGVLILAALLLGLFLGGARAGIRVLQGKPAASEPEFLSINLRDQPKALFAGSPERRPDGSGGVHP